MRTSKIQTRVILIVLLTQFACAPMWNRHRERERGYAVRNAQVYSDRGQCKKAIPTLDRALARPDIGHYGQKAAIMRIRCYEMLGMTAEARALQRLIADFYERPDPAYPNEGGTSVFQIRQLDAGAYEPPPSVLKLQRPSYSEYARRSKIIGRVVVAFKLDGRDQPIEIRVLEMPHPLLATWAIEAVARTRRHKKTKSVLIAPGGHYVTTFNFAYYWADRSNWEDDDESWKEEYDSWDTPPEKP